MMARSRMGVAAVLLALPLAAIAPAQAASFLAQSGQDDSLAAQQTPVFQLDVRRVPVDVVVTDKKGNPVRGLTKDDFVVKEDSTPQTVLTFDYLDGSHPSFIPPKLPALPANTYVNLPDAPEQGPL